MKIVDSDNRQPRDLEQFAKEKLILEATNTPPAAKQPADLLTDAAQRLGYEQYSTSIKEDRMYEDLVAAHRPLAERFYGDPSVLQLLAPLLDELDNMLIDEFSVYDCVIASWTTDLRSLLAAGIIEKTESGHILAANATSERLRQNINCETVLNDTGIERARLLEVAKRVEHFEIKIGNILKLLEATEHFFYTDVSVQIDYHFREYPPASKSIEEALTTLFELGLVTVDNLTDQEFVVTLVEALVKKLRTARYQRKSIDSAEYATAAKKVQDRFRKK